MKLTFQQKALAIVVCLGATAVGFDRFVLSGGVSGPHSAAADSSSRSAAADAGRASASAGHRPGADASAQDKRSAKAKADDLSQPISHAALGQKLEKLASDGAVDSSHLPDALAVPESWRQQATAPQTSTPRASSAAVSASAQPNQRSTSPRSSQGKTYRLEAVFTDRRGRGVAVVGGQTLHVGDSLGVYTLVRIGPRSATFSRGNHLIKLALSDE